MAKQATHPGGVAKCNRGGDTRQSWEQLTLHQELENEEQQVIFTGWVGNEPTIAERLKIGSFPSRGTQESQEFNEHLLDEMTETFGFQRIRA
jgi:hypothetical protein